METKTRNIIIVVVIIAIIAGVGIPLGIVFLGPKYGEVQIGILATPGAPADVSDDKIIKVGILCSMTEIQGEGVWTGAYLAIDKINRAGGLDIGGETYYLGIVSEDTYETEVAYDTAKGVSAAQKLLADDDPDFVIGGFRTEMLSVYRENVMAAKKIFINVGAATTSLCQDVLDDYDKYKYFFRMNPFNSSGLVKEIFEFIGYLKGYMTTVLEKNITKVAIIREGLAWTEGMSAILNSLYLPFGIPGLAEIGLEIVKEVAYPLTDEATEFAGYLAEFDTLGAQIIIPIISAQGGLIMTSQYALTKPKAIIAGIDVMSQLDTFWAETGGGCEHEITMTGVRRVPKTPLTIAYWDDYNAHYGHIPLYTSSGGYDAINLLADAILEADSIATDDVITALESFTPENPYVGAGGTIGFLSSHDILEGTHGGTRFAHVLWVQWQSPGKSVSVPSPLTYPNSLAQANITLPSWGIN